jgi:hypothetical protein
MWLKFTHLVPQPTIIGRVANLSGFFVILSVLV